MRNMQVVAEQKLQCMLARFECQLRCRAAVTKMDMVLICGYWHVHRWQAGVDQDVMMAGVCCVVASPYDFHCANAKLDRKRAGNGVPICRGNKEYAGTLA